MAAFSFLSSKPIALGLQHFGIGLLGLGAVTGAGAGAVQVLGNEADAGPKVEIAVPIYTPPAHTPVDGTVHEATNTHANQTGLMAMLPWRVADGGMSVPNTNGANQAMVDLNTPIPDEHAVSDPHVTSVAEAASATPAVYANGSARILAPQMGTTTALTNSEAGVRVTRGGQSASGLPSAPIAGVSQQGPNGLLPAIATDGRTPFDVYRRPDSAGGRARVALVVGGLGLNARITERAINQLPPEVTLSFVPYADNLQGWINRARAQGHEVLIEIPLEPFDFPDNDTGPQTLMSSGSAEENQRRLEYLLAKASGYFGVVNYMGGKFASSPAASAGFMRNLKNRGLGFISDGSSASLGTTARTNGVKTITADRNIDQRPSAADIEAQLGALEAMATQRGNALGFGVAYSVTIDKINAWASAAAGRGVTLIPASALAS